VTGRHVAPAPGEGRRPLGRLGLLRHSLVAERATAVLLAALTVVTTVFLVAVPRVESVAHDRALGDAVRTAVPAERDLGLRLTTSAGRASRASDTPTEGPTAPFAPVDAAVRTAMGPQVQGLLSGGFVAAQSDPLAVARSTGEPLDVSSGELAVRVDDAALERVRWVTGGPPGAPSATRTLRDSADQANVVQVVPVALSARTAAAWGVSAGDVLDLSAGANTRRVDSPTSVVVSGTFEPLDPADEVWAAEPRMLGIAKILTPQGGTTDQAAVIAPLASYSVVGDGLWRGPADEPPPSPSPALDHTWRYTLAADRLTRDDVGLLRDFLVRLDTDPTVWAGVQDVPAVTTGLGGLLDRYERDVAVTGVLTSFVTGGVTALAVLVLALTALLGAQRRDREVRLLRARGASRSQVLTLVGVATSVLAVPLAVVAALAVLLLVPGDTTRSAWVEVALVVVLPPLVAVVATARRVRAIDEVPEESTRTVRAARRIVLEAAVVLLAVLAVTTVRSRGAVIAAGRTDWYAAVTPVLVALAAAVVALRLMPWPVSRLARLAERGRGLVVFVGLTRAARTGAGAAVPLAALVVGATLVTLMATLTASVSEQRQLAALRAVGADARVDAARVDAPDVAALAARPGVEAAIPAHVDAGATVSADGRTTSVVVVAVDPARYAELLAGTPLAFSPPGATGDGRLPVVLSGGPAIGDLDLGLRGLSTPGHRVATVPSLERAFAGQGRVVALVPLDALVEALPTTQPNTVFLRASADAQRDLEATAARDRSQLGGLVTGVTTVTGVAAGVADRALPSLVAATFLVGVLLAAVLSFLAVLLLLAATRAERNQLAIRLRTMGLPHGRERRLAWAEVLPLLAVGVVTGGLVGVLVPSALAPALDLAPFTGAVTRLPVLAHPLTGLLVALVALGIGSLALLTDAASARRGSLADHLRRGDTA
jgi:putative ABC transport system permease protein